MALRVDDETEFSGMILRAEEDIRHFKGETTNRFAIWLPHMAILLACVLYGLAFLWLLD